MILCAQCKEDLRYTLRTSIMHTFNECEDWVYLCGRECLRKYVLENSQEEQNETFSHTYRTCNNHF